MNRNNLDGFDIDNFNHAFKDLCKRSEGLRPQGALPEAAPKARTARLVAKLVGTYDQSNGATVRIVPTGKDFLISVRPRGRRREYSLLLSEVARVIITRVALAEKR